MSTATTAVEVIDILVTGLAEVGKTTIIKSISQQIGSNPHGWTAGLVEVDEALNVKFLEPPAARSFDFMWMRDMIEQADVPGFIVVCDSSRPEFFGETVGILETIRAMHPDTPCVMIANKQDHPHAWTPGDIRLALGIPQDIPVIPCIGKNVSMVRDAVIQLLYAIWGEQPAEHHPEAPHPEPLELHSI